MAGDAPTKAKNEQLLAAGEVLFDQGDPGGDLFFINSGLVEIYTQQNGQDVVLAEMGPGEIIGVMTCMTSAPRLASARAKTDVLYKRVAHANIRKTLRTLPNWMKIVLKEFTIRLSQMNKNFSEASLQVKKLGQDQVTGVYTAAQMAGTAATFGEAMAIRVDDEQFVEVEVLLEKLETALNVSEESLRKTYEVIKAAGLLREEIEPDHRRKVLRLDALQKLAYFAQFVRESKRGPKRRLVKANFNNKQTRTMSAIVKYADRLRLDLDKRCELLLSDLNAGLEKATGVRFHRAALAKGEKLKLLEIRGEGGEQKVVFVPAELGRTVACIEAMRRLNAMSEGDDRAAPRAQRSAA